MSKKSAHNFFWIIVILTAAILFGMIYFLSVTQANEDKKSEMLEDKLDEQISTTKGIESSIRQITEENEALKDTIAEKDAELISLYKKNETLTVYSEIVSLYSKRDNDERMKLLLDTLDVNLLSAEQQSLIAEIKAEINKEPEENVEIAE